MDITSSESIDASDNINDVVDRGDESVLTSDNEEHMEVEQPVESTGLTVLVSDENTSEVVVPTSPSLLVPSLKGKMLYSGGLVTCKGSWAMSDAAHEILGQTSEFEFKLVKADEGSTQYPFNGKYQGWFMLKQPLPMKGSIKIDDKEMNLSFVVDENGTDHAIQGQGVNKFGRFNLRGTLTESGDVHVYREYYTLAPLSTSTSKRKHSFSGGSPTDGDANKRKGFNGRFDESAIPGAPIISPRESSGRVRKVSTLMREYEDATYVAPQAKTPTSAGHSATPKSSSSSNLASFGSSSSTKPSVAPPALIRQESQSDRTQRLSAPLKKCGELLREIAKHPQAVWFLEPVDYVKFGIPDYPTIVKQPMDFRTIRLALEALKYESHEAFADHVRLVFKNAMTFNQLRDNPVHIAAREMSARFEDRYRQLITQIGVYTPSDSGSDSRPSGGSHVGAGRPSLGGGGGNKKKAHGPVATKQPLLPGPRPMPVAYLGGGADNSSHQIMEMQRMMAAMQEEINLLRSAVRENEIVKRLHETKDAAHNPLTFEEKKKLIAQIHKLPPSRMEQVLEIIQAAIPKSDSDQDGDIEVPLDALDTFTLRKLQRFIEDHQVKKKPPAVNGNGSSAPQLQRQSSTSSARGDSTTKKPRAKSVSKSNSSVALMGGSADLNMFEHEDMLFSTDCFDELRTESTPLKEESPSTGFPGLHSFEQSASTASEQNGSGEEYRRPRAGSLDEDFEDLMDMKSPNHAADGGSGHHDFNVNADAWQMGSLEEDSSQGLFASEEVSNSQSWQDAQQEVMARKARENDQRLHF